MAKVQIETYRGFDIAFDTEDEKFSALGDDWTSNNKTLTACKKAIDEYIKENYEFKPIIVHSDDNDLDKKRIIGIRKDQRFVYQSESGETYQISEYDEKRIIIYNPYNDHVYDNIRDLKDKIKNLYEQVEKEKKLIKGITIYEYKRQLPKI